MRRPRPAGSSAGMPSEPGSSDRVANRAARAVDAVLALVRSDEAAAVEPRVGALERGREVLDALVAVLLSLPVAERRAVGAQRGGDQFIILLGHTDFPPCGSARARLNLSARAISFERLRHLQTSARRAMA